MELVGAHKKALSALDSAEARSESESRNMSKEVGDMGITDGVAQKKERKMFQMAKQMMWLDQKDRLSKKKGERQVKLGFQFIGNISLWQTEELLCLAYCWHRFSISSFKLEAITG